jgi:hypothetical protein
MMSDAELDELAADIKVHGLLHPIAVKDGVLIDGRNRREACLRANVTPQFEELNGLDPVAYILSANINRRHLTKGQRAMAVAKLYPEPEKGGRGKKASVPEGFSQGKVSEARTVLRWLPELADLVMAGTKPLNEAYAEAQRLKEQADAEPPRLELLRERAADLADLVDEGRMTLVEAESAQATRLSERRRERQALLDVLEGLERHLDFFAGARRQHLVATMSESSDDHSRFDRLLDQWLANLSATKEALFLCRPKAPRSNGS